MPDARFLTIRTFWCTLYPWCTLSLPAGKNNSKFLDIHVYEEIKDLLLLLAQRLMHLETYSDKLSDMLDKNQNADDKAREKFTKEVNIIMI